MVGFKNQIILRFLFTSVYKFTSIFVVIGLHLRFIRHKTMWIKLIITIVTLFLLFDEYFKVIDKVGKKNRRRVVLSVLAILSIFSLIDVIIEVNEGNDLVKKANTIIIQSDTLIDNTNGIIKELEKNIESVEESGRSIIAIDSVLKEVKDTVSNQVRLLETAVNKSIELVKLEEKKFKQDEAKIDVFNSEIKFVFNKIDSTHFDIQFDFRNLGKRYATNIKFESKTLLYNKILGTIQVIKSSDSYFSDDLTTSSKGIMNFKIDALKDKMFSKNYSVIFILKCNYEDAISRKKLQYINHHIANDLKGIDTNFSLIVDFDIAETINKLLINENLNDYLIKIEN